MVTLRIYFDESSTQFPYVVGGLAMQPDYWDAFSSRWQIGLDAPPRIKYLKLNQALGLKCQFEGWAEPQRDAKLVSMAKVIAQETTMFGAGCYLHRGDFEQQKARIKKKIYRDPYYFCMATTMLFSVYGECQILGYDKIDWVLDKSKAAERMRQLYYSDIKPLFQRLGECVCLDDKETLPLQAADYHCGLVRQKYEPESNHRRIPGVYALDSADFFTSVFELQSKGIADAIASPLFTGTGSKRDPSC